MSIQIGYSLEKAVFDFFRSLIIGIVQRHLVEGRKIRLNQIEPGTVGGQPVKLNALWMCLCPFSHRSCFVGAKIIENEMNASLGPRGHHHFLKEIPAVFAGFPGCPTTRGQSRMGTEGRKELQCPVFSTIAAGAAGRQEAPTFTTPGYSLQGPQFIKAHHRPIGRRVPIEANYGVFFTSKSGSVLRHQV